MSWAAIATAVFTLGIVWGGFLVVLVMALMKERHADRGPGLPDTDGPDS